MPARGNRAATLAQFKLSPDGAGRSLPVVSVVKPCCYYYSYNSNTHIVYAKCGKMLKKEELSTVKEWSNCKTSLLARAKGERERVWPPTDVWAREEERERERNYRKNQKNVTTYTKFSVAQRRRRRWRRRRSMSVELSRATLTVVQRFPTELDVCTFVWVFTVLISAANLAILPSSLAFFNDNIVNKAISSLFLIPTPLNQPFYFILWLFIFIFGTTVHCASSQGSLCSACVTFV